MNDFSLTAAEARAIASISGLSRIFSQIRDAAKNHNYHLEYNIPFGEERFRQSLKEELVAKGFKVTLKKITAWREGESYVLSISW